MSKCAHDTDAEFDLRYPRKDVIKLEPYSHICIDLKVALKIPATTIVQLASRNSLAKKEINIRGRIIDAEYIKNIIAMLQNDLEKTYIIEPNKKIAQTIFLSLVQIAQLMLVRNKEELEITARGIQGQALRTVLSQKKLDGKEHPVTYASQSLSSAEKNYGTPALKHLAIYWAVRK
ncbi:hypothetical protein G9A89_008899 [Geosiphon pyriformis]|nr:hypothetical protein G9A89_008899 [Geosiphon pyriformis]